jgi:hypothetical protein
MSIFDEFRTGFTQWHDAHASYERDSAVFAIRFVNDFKTYIGAPESYHDMIGDTRFYVQQQAVTQADSGNYEFRNVTTLMEAIERCQEDGFWETGITLTLEKATNTFPKSYFTFLVRFILRDMQCDMQIGFDKREFSFDRSDVKNAHPVFAYMVDLVRRTLTIRPWDIPSKQPIGFIWPQTENSA